jgi:phytoene dehydrogenase-like protein
LRYDVAIIGGGAEGLIAAALLGRARLRTIVLERNEQPGGRCITREFHPGFRASPFVDEIAAIPAELHWALDLSRRGAIFAPAPASVALWPDRQSVLRPHHNSGTCRLASLVAEAADDVRRRALADAGIAPARWWPTLGHRRTQPWPDGFAQASLAGAVSGYVPYPATAAHLIALATAGRAVDPLAAGTALHLLAPGLGQSGFVTGGLARLGNALAAAARDAGAEIRCGLEVGELRHRRSRALGVSLADGTQIEAAAVISTLDFCRTFLSLFHWRDLPKDVAARTQTFRFAGSAARILFALSQAPRLDREILRGPIFVAPDLAKMKQAEESWRSATIPESPPIMLRVVSACDPGLAPVGAATVAATIGGIPHRLFDGAWSHSRREQLFDIVRNAIETVLPGFAKAVIGYEVIVPPDIEQAIGVCEGDLCGGEISPDQMLGERPGLAVVAPRTFLRGLYVAGKSTPAGPLATGASAAIAAHAVLADFAAHRIKRMERAE